MGRAFHVDGSYTSTGSKLQMNLKLKRALAALTPVCLCCRYLRLRRLVARLRLLTRDLRLRGRAIVPAVHRKARHSPRAGKKARTHQMGTGYRRVTKEDGRFVG